MCFLPHSLSEDVRGSLLGHCNCFPNLLTHLDVNLVGDELEYDGVFFRLPAGVVSEEPDVHDISSIVGSLQVQARDGLHRVAV